MQIFIYNVDIDVQGVKLHVNFPSRLTIEFGTSSTPEQQIQNCSCMFNCKLSHKVQIPYKEGTRTHIETEHSLIFKLHSSGGKRPRIIGRIRIPFHELVHRNLYSQFETHQLQYSPISAFVRFRVKLGTPLLKQVPFDCLKEELKYKVNPNYIRVKQIEQMDYDELGPYLQEKMRHIEQKCQDVIKKIKNL